MFPRRGKTSIQERGAIAALHNAGKSPREISIQLGRDVKTVKLWTTRWANTGNVLRQVGSGRPRLTTAAQDVMLADCIRAKPMTSRQEILGK